MKTGVHFSAILLFWIIGISLAFYAMYPEVQKTLTAVESVNSTELENIFSETTRANKSPKTIKTTKNTEPEISSTKQAISYTPLAIFDIINFR